MALVILAPKMISITTKNEVVKTDTAWFDIVRKLEKKNTEASYNSTDSEDSYYSIFHTDRTLSNYDENKPTGGGLFYFDPNSLSAEGWKKLGIKEKTIKTIQNY